MEGIYMFNYLFYGEMGRDSSGNVMNANSIFLYSKKICYILCRINWRLFLLGKMFFSGKNLIFCSFRS